MNKKHTYLYLLFSIASFFNLQLFSQNLNESWGFNDKDEKNLSQINNLPSLFEQNNNSDLSIEFNNKFIGLCDPPIVTTPIYYCLNSTSVPLTATALPGATLNWYGTNAVGGTATSVAPTPSTSTVGITTYYVSQTTASCESTRSAIVVNVVADTGGVLSLFCDGPNSTPTTTAFDWNNVPGYLGYYYSYSVAGGVPVTGFQVSPSHFNVPVPSPGTPVTFTILSVKGLPCVASVSVTCHSTCTSNTTTIFSNIPSSICAGSVAPLLPTTSDNLISGTWSPAVVSNTLSGSYVFTPDPNLFPCALPVTKGIVVTPSPTAGILSGVQNICTGLTTIFSSTTTGGTWSSNKPSIATINVSTGLVTGISAGTATMTYTVKGTGGCSDVSDTRNITVTAAPNAGIVSGTQNICQGLTTTYTTTSTGGTWISDKPAIAIIDSTTGLVTGVSAGTATITYTVVGSGGCSNATATRTITVAATPTTGILSGVQNICTGLTTIFSSTTGGGTWSSNKPSIATINVSTGLVTGISAGTATMTYTVKGTGGCSDVSDTRNITVTAAPNAGIVNGTPNICQGLTTTYTTTSTGGTWISDKPAIAIIDSTTGLVTGVSAGTATITYTVVGSGGCSNATATRIITVTATPTAGILSGVQNICTGLTTIFSSTTGGGTWSSNKPSIATINVSTGLVTGISAGTATMTYTVKGTGGCSDVSDTRNITVTAAPNAGIVSGTPNICQGLTTTYTTTSTGGTWSSDKPAIATIDASTGLVTGVSAGTATMTYTVVGTGGCPDAKSSLILNVNNQKIPNFENISMCYGSKAPTLSNTSPNGITGTWIPPVINNTNDGIYVFTPNLNQCATVQSINVYINQDTLKSVDYDVTNPFSENQVITILAHDVGNYLYQLDNGPSQTSNVFENVNIGIHKIKVIDVNGCSQPIIVNNVVVIGYPQFFTPNGDGYNDTWNIFSLSEQLNSKIFIYDRYGKLLKEINPKSPGWDGTYNGKDLPSSDYWFTVEYTDKNISNIFRSHFTLKR